MLKRRIQPIVLACALLCTALDLPGAVAESASSTTQDLLTFAVPEGNLDRALNEFAQQAGVVLGTSGALTQGKRSQGVSGQFTIRAALTRLLEGTGIRARFEDPNTVTLEAVSASTPLQLAPIRVVGTEPARYEAGSASSAFGIDIPLLDTPRSVQVVPEQIILDQSSQDLRDALRNVSGIQLLNETGGATDAYYIRGHRSVNVFQDGFAIARNASRLQTSNIERVEVVKGPTAFTYGSTDVGGVINVVTKRPLDTARHVATVTLDEHGRQDLLIDSTGPLNRDGTLLYRLVGGIEDSETWRETTRPDELKREILAPSLTWKISPKDTLTLAMEFTRDELPAANRAFLFEDPLGNLSIYDDDLDRGFHEPGNSRETERDKFALEYQREFDNGWVLHAQTGFEKTELLGRAEGSSPVAGITAAVGPTDTASTAIALLGAVPGVSITPRLTQSGLLVRNQGGFTNEDDLFNFSIQLSGTLATGSISHEWVVGGDYQRQEFNANSFFSLIDSADSLLFALPGAGALFPPGTLTSAFSIINVFDPVYGTAQGESALAFTNDIERTQLGLYLRDQITLSESWQIALGVRADDFKQDLQGNDILAFDPLQRVTAGAGPRAPQDTDSQWEVSPNISLLYKPRDNVTFYTTYSESFQPSGLFTNTITLQTSTIDPTEGEQYEIGFKTELLDSKLFINAAIFDTTRTNVVVDRVDAGLPNEGDPIVADGIRTKGFELDATVQFSDGLSVIFGYAYLDSEDEESGLRPTNVAENSAHLWVTYEFTEGTLRGLGVGGGANYVGTRYNDFANTFELDAYTTVEVTAFYYIPVGERSQIRIQAGVKNLSDEEYFFSGGDLGLGVGDPRTAYASIGYEF
ncbi:MAG: TonB-dependent receptor [Pseudomonadota bacterium]